jgi:hypothetical protein
MIEATEPAPLSDLLDARAAAEVRLNAAHEMLANAEDAVKAAQAEVDQAQDTLTRALRRELSRRVSHAAEIRA